MKKSSVKNEKKPQYKTYETTEELVEDILYLILMGVKRDRYNINKFHSIDFRYDAGQNAPQNLNTFINDAVDRINQLELKYNEIMENVPKDMEDMVDELYEDIEPEFHDIFPILGCMHGDDADYFYNMIYQYWQTQ